MKEVVEGGLPMTLLEKEVSQVYQRRLVFRPYYRLSSSLVPPPKRIYFSLLGGPIHPPSPKSGQKLN